jgi:hypothetical protein
MIFVETAMNPPRTSKLRSRRISFDPRVTPFEVQGHDRTRGRSQMSENVRSAMASENFRFMVAAVIALALIGIYQFASPESTEQYTELSDDPPSAGSSAPAVNMGNPAR